MDWSVVTDFLNPKLIIICIFLWVIGKFLKDCPIFSKEWLIPYILTGISLIITPVYLYFIIYMPFSGELIVAGIIQAILAAGIAVYGNELIKQYVKKRKTDSSTSSTK
jgi:hypothetical protein